MAIFDELKSVAGVLQEAGKIPQYQQILEVQEKLLEMQKHIFDLEVENRELKEKVKTREDLIVKNDAYWLKDGDGPFCLTCHGAKDLLVRMVSWGSGQHKCNNCNHTVDTDPVALERLRRQQEIESNSNYDPFSSI